MDSQETKIFVAITVITIIVGAALLYLFILLYKQQRKNIVLQRKIALAEISSLEEERSRIAADLHDDLGPLLSAIKFRVNSVNTKSIEDTNEITTSTKLLDDAIIRLRQISNDLLPTSLLRKGLPEAIQEFIEISSQKKGLKIDFEYNTDLAIAPDKKIHLFRMTQEAVLNCIKHAGASKIVVVLKKERDLIHLTITDNGCGIVSKDAPSESGRGLTSLTNRASILGGYLHIHSEVNKGTILDFEIPIE